MSRRLGRSSHLIKRTLVGSLASRSYTTTLKKTVLHPMHVQLGAKMVPFCGWDMPVQYKESIIDSHLHTRTQAGLFDVSHMGQIILRGKDRLNFLEQLVVADLQGLPENHARLSLFTNEKGGIKDDTVISRHADHLYVVINAGCTDKDIAHLREHLSSSKNKGKDIQLEILEDHSLVALQGPAAASVLEKHMETAGMLKGMPFMTGRITKLRLHQVPQPVTARITRCGYTGEDGFEISIASREAPALWRTLLEEHGNTVWPIGLAARDSLRLDAGLCLYGNDITEETNPIEAGLAWTIGKRRREEGGFLGSDIILRCLKQGVNRKRVGFMLEEGVARAHAPIHSSSGDLIGEVTSGGYSPSLRKAIGMGYVPNAHAAAGTSISIQVRKKMLPAHVHKLPFVPTNFYKP